MDRGTDRRRLAPGTPVSRVISRALRAHTRSFAGDVVLLGAAVASLVLSLSLATSVPVDLAEAPATIRTAFVDSFRVLIATYGAVLAAAYGSFRYTVDRRDGVIAQRLTMQPRSALFVVRLPTSAVGGAIVASAGAIGGQVALTVFLPDAPVDWSAIGSTLALGAVAGLWGMGLGVIVQVHLGALFVVSLSMSAALLLAMFWSAGAVYLPPLVMLEAVGFDVSAVGIPPSSRLHSAVATAVTAGAVLTALLGGGVAFLRRDVR